MPALGNALDFGRYEARNLRAHILGVAPATPSTGQLYYNSGDNTLYWWDGSQWVSARGGAAATPPATTGALGTIQLAGDLAGTATSPQIAAGVITDADVNGGAAIGESKLNLATDAAAGVGSRRTLGFGATQALPGTTPIHSMYPPTGALNLNNQRIIALADPVVATDAANKQYVDGVAQGLDAKQSVRAASTANIATFSGNQTIDGVACVTGDRVLAKNQTQSFLNGIYIIGSPGWTRTTDADAWTELPGAFVFVEQGTVNADTGWVCTVDQGGTLGSTAMPWTQFSGAGSIVAGAGLVQNGNTHDVGAGAGITVNADSIQVANDGITNAMIADGAIDVSTADVTGILPLTKGGTGAGTANAARGNINAAGLYTSTTHVAGTTITIPASVHQKGGGPWQVVQVLDVATGNVELPDVNIASNGDVTITYGVSVAANSKRVVIIGQ